MSAIPRGDFSIWKAQRELQVPQIPATSAAAFGPQPEHPWEDLKTLQNLLAGIKSSLEL